MVFILSFSLGCYDIGVSTCQRSQNLNLNNPEYFRKTDIAPVDPIQRAIILLQQRGYSILEADLSA